MAQVAVIVDSQAARGESFRRHLVEETSLEVTVVASGETLLRNLIARNGAAQPDVVLYVMDEMATAIIRNIKQLRRDIPIIVLVDHTQADQGMDAVSAGAENLLLMPVHPAQLTLSVLNSLTQRDLRMVVHQTYAGPRLELESLEAQSSALQATIFLARRVMETNEPVVLEGPAGAGRELLARAIHTGSDRHDQPFIVFNAASYPSKMLGEQLFGSRKHEGVLARIGSGTLFLRNVGAMPESARQKLVNAVNGGDKKLRFQGRFLLAEQDASRRPTAKEKRELRQFYSQINALTIPLPPLKNMREDIPAFVWIFCHHFAAVEGKQITKISQDAMRLLKEMSWPDNLEQLSRAVFQAVMCCEGQELQSEDFRHLRPFPHASVSYLGVQANGHASSVDGNLSCIDPMGNIRRLQDVEQEFIRYALERYSGHVSEVARCLGIGRSTLYRKLAGKDEE